MLQKSKTCHSRESGNPEISVRERAMRIEKGNPTWRNLIEVDSRFRRNDGKRGGFRFRGALPRKRGDDGSLVYATIE